MSIDAFLKVDGVLGESVDAKRAGASAILSWSWAVEQPGSSQDGGGSGVGRADYRDLMLTKYVDRATPVLWRACCTGARFATATLILRKAGGAALEYTTIKMQSVGVTHCAITTNLGDQLITEEICLSFAGLAFEYVPQLSNGLGGPAVLGGWDFAANQEI